MEQKDKKRIETRKKNGWWKNPEKTKLQMSKTRLKLMDEDVIPRKPVNGFKKGYDERRSKTLFQKNHKLNLGGNGGSFKKGHKESVETRKKRLQNAFNGKKVFPNRPEKTMIKLFKQNDIPLHYVGNGKLMIEGKCPDFVCNPSKKVVLLHGDYWHYLKQKKSNPLLTRQEVEEKDKSHYRANFFDCLVVWEHELKNPNQVVNRIQEFIK